MNKTTFSVIVSGIALMGAGCVAPVSAPPPSPSGSPVTVVVGQRLDLSGTGLTSLPAYVLGQTKLEELDISDNALTGALPSEIGKLTNLKVLDASGNQMTGVPAEVGQLRGLRTLDLSNNRLTGLPMELGQLTNLETLDLSGNDIAKQDLDAIRKNIPQAKIIE